jgi:hypothetical protein
MLLFDKIQAGAQKFFFQCVCHFGLLNFQANLHEVPIYIAYKTLNCTFRDSKKGTPTEKY